MTIFQHSVIGNTSWLYQWDACLQGILTEREGSVSTVNLLSWVGCLLKI